MSTSDKYRPQKIQWPELWYQNLSSVIAYKYRQTEYTCLKEN